MESPLRPQLSLSMAYHESHAVQSSYPLPPPPHQIQDLGVPLVVQLFLFTLCRFSRALNRSSSKPPPSISTKRNHSDTEDLPPLDKHISADTTLVSNDIADEVPFTTYEQLRHLSSTVEHERFVFCRASKFVTFISVTQSLNPQVELSLVINEQFVCHVHVFGRILSTNNPVIATMAAVCRTAFSALVA